MVKVKLVKVMFATRPYEGQISIDDPDNAFRSPIWRDIEIGSTVKISVQNQLQGMELDFWEMNGVKITVAGNKNPVNIKILKYDESITEVEVYAVYNYAVYKKP